MNRITQKRKVLFVAHHLTVGGVQKSLISALNAIDYDKNDVTLYIRKNRTDLVKLINPRVTVIINNDKNHYYRRFYSIILQILILFYKMIHNFSMEKMKKERLGEYIRECEMKYEKRKYFANQKFDVAIAYVQGYTAIFVAKCISAKQKIVFYQGSTDEWHNYHVEVFPLYNVIAVEHEDVKNLIMDWYNGVVSDRQFKVVENYTDRAFLYEQAKEIDIPQEKNGVTICSCGRMAPVKGFDLAIEAAKILRDQGYSFRWNLVGDGPERMLIEKMIQQYRLQDNVFLLGMQKNPYPYMLNCDIYVQPSKEEALSIAMLESRLLTRPMVSTKTVGGLTMVKDGETGILTEIDASSLADGIRKLIDDSVLLHAIEERLSAIDYSTEENRYRAAWKKLLEE